MKQWHSVLAASTLLAALATERTQAAKERVVLFEEQQFSAPVVEAGLDGFLVMGQDDYQRLAVRRVEIAGRKIRTLPVVRLPAHGLTARDLEFDHSGRFLACWEHLAGDAETFLVCGFLDKYGRRSGRIFSVAETPGGVNRIHISRDPLRDRWIVHWNEQYPGSLFGNLDRLRVLNGDGSPASKAVPADLRRALAYAPQTDALLAATTKGTTENDKVAWAARYFGSAGRPLSRRWRLGAFDILDWPPMVAHTTPNGARWFAVWGSGADSFGWRGRLVERSAGSRRFNRVTPYTIGSLALGYVAPKDLFLVAWSERSLVWFNRPVEKVRVWGQWLRPEGTPLGGTIRISQRKGEYGEPSIACLEDQEACLATWKGRSSTQPNKVKIYGRLLGTPARH
jgi:hypothetical protein